MSPSPPDEPMTDLTRDELDGLLGAWALDALEDRDRVAVDAALARHPDLAATARTLREAAGRLAAADTTSTATGDVGRDAIVAAATATRPPGVDARLAGEPASTAEAFADQVGALSRVLARVPDDRWDAPVAAYPGWSVRDLVAHLVAVESYAASFLGFEPYAVEGAPESDHVAMTEATVERNRERPVEEVVAEWRRLAERSAAHVLALDHDGLEAPMPLHGIPFRVTTAIVARAFELWTHADDIRVAVGEPRDRPAPAVVHRMATESVASLPTAAAFLPEAPGPSVAHVVLTGHGGGTWTLAVGGADHDEPDLTLVADVVDYCRVVSRRLDVAAIDLVVEGDRRLAEQLLRASQFVAM